MPDGTRKGVRRRRVLLGPARLVQPRRRRRRSRRSIPFPARTSPDFRPTRRSRRFPSRCRSPACRTRAGGRSRTSADQLRRHRRQHDRSREAAVHGVRARLLQRLVRCSIARCLPARSPRFSGLAVTNVFGERFWIEAAGRGVDKDWQRWSMFTINVRNAPAGQHPPTRRLLLLPTVAKGADEPATRGGAAGPRRGGEHGVGRRADRAACQPASSRTGSEVATQTLAYLQRTSPRRRAAAGPPPVGAPSATR